jgi:hypothetical protein
VTTDRTTGEDRRDDDRAVDDEWTTNERLVSDEVLGGTPTDALASNRPDDVSDTEKDDEGVEVLAVEIEQTRDEMTGTVEAIGERLDPSNIVEDAKETVREATVGKVEAMANQATDAISEVGTTAQEAGSGIIEMLRRNPIPAAMAGIGLGWLWMNRESGSRNQMARQMRPRYQGYGYEGSAYGYQDSGSFQGPSAAVDRGFQQNGGGFGQAAGGGASAVGQKASEVGESVGQVAGQVGQTVGQLPETVGGTVQRVGWTARQAIEENALAAGAIALAVGTAVGLALPATEAEKKVMGNVGEKAIRTAESTVTESMQQMETAQR